MNRLTYILVSVITFTAGISIVRFFSDSPFIRGFGGDFLVVIFIFGLVKSAFPALHSMKTAAGVFLFSIIVETLQYFELVKFLDIRNRILKIILGSTFDLMDILAYFSGLTAILVMEMTVLYFRRSCPSQKKIDQ